MLQKSGYAHGLTKKLIDCLKSALTYQLYFYYLNMASKPGAFHLTFTGQTIIVYTSSYVHDYTTYMYNIQVFMHNFLILCILSNLMNTFAQFHSIF